MSALAFLTCHGKASAVAPALAEQGFQVFEVSDYDTDRFGTFSRDVPRLLSVQETALAKARLAAERGGVRYGLGSEGSFGLDPFLRAVPWAEELLCWWDSARGYAVYARHASSATNYAQKHVGSLPEAFAFAEKAGFPEHALLVGRAHEPWFCKGVRALDQLTQRVETVLARQPSVWLETDMRAHCNPTRQQQISQAAQVLTGKLAQHCPACEAPGYALAHHHPGLPCEACEAPTPIAKVQSWLCGACGYNEEQPVAQAAASAAHCHYCNP